MDKANAAKYQSYARTVQAQIQEERVPIFAKYGEYLDDIQAHAERNKKIVTPAVEEPLFYYSSIGQEGKNAAQRTLRYKGQEVAKLFFARDQGSRWTLKVQEAKPHTGKREHAEINQDYFMRQLAPEDIKKYAPCLPCVFGDGNGNGFSCEWKDAENFIRFFRELAPKKEYSPAEEKSQSRRRKHDEHTLESWFLTQLERGRLPGVVPIHLNGRRFQMTTPLRGSDGEKNKSGKDILARNKKGELHFKGGGIDILGKSLTDKGESVLTVIELKDIYQEKEPPCDVICQAIAYAVFLRELVREETHGQKWYNYLMHNGEMPAVLLDVPQKLMIRCVVAMPDLRKNSRKMNPDCFAGIAPLTLEDGGHPDQLELHCVRINARVDEDKAAEKLKNAWYGVVEDGCDQLFEASEGLLHVY